MTSLGVDGSALKGTMEGILQIYRTGANVSNPLDPLFPWGYFVFLFVVFGFFPFQKMKPDHCRDWKSSDEVPE